jgi:putative phosphoserine phosphatase/1-acylglycerol-3-phosphate O-acyltransferase
MYGVTRPRIMTGTVAAYFDLDGTLLDASSEKTLATELAKRRPWRIPVGAVSWTLGFLGNLLRGRAFYDAARNRGHFSLASWQVLEAYSSRLAIEKLAPRVSEEAKAKLAWHREQGHRLVLVTATIAPMAEAMAEVLGMDAVYGCGPEERTGIMSGSERGWSVPRRKGKVPVVEADALAHGHDLEQCYGYGNTHADSWFMRITGHPVAINAESSLRRLAEERGWPMHQWRI